MKYHFVRLETVITIKDVLGDMDEETVSSRALDLFIDLIEGRLDGTAPELDIETVEAP